MRGLALILALAATPLAAQDSGNRLPVFPMDGGGSGLPTAEPQQNRPTVQRPSVTTQRPGVSTERPGVTVRNRNGSGGVNVVSRSVWGVKPRPRPSATLARVQTGLAPSEITANDDGVAIPSTQTVFEPAPRLPGAADAGITAPAPRIEAPAETAAADPAFAAPEPPPAEAEVLALMAPAPPSTRPTPRPQSELAAPASPLAEAVEQAVAQAQEDDLIASPFADPPAQGDVTTPFDQATAEPRLPVMDPSEETISTAIIVETLNATPQEVLTLRPSEAPTVAVANAPGAILRGLDKVSGEVQDLELAEGETAQLGRLTVQLGECRYPAADPAGNAYAWVEIGPEGTTDKDFAGWMIASSPALSALDHPRYDVWVIRCSKS